MRRRRGSGPLSAWTRVRCRTPSSGSTGRRSLRSISDTPDLRERLRWAWAGLARRLESLPPFWTSFALTLTETVGAGILALPIALAGIGPLPGILLMIVLGLVNVVTIIGAAEAAARSGTVRYGSGFMGRMVREYLGNFASLVLIVAVALLCFLTLPVLYIGFGSAMAGFTGLPEPVWVVGLFLACLYLLRRESLDATVGSALVVGAVNIAIILLLSMLAFTQLDPANLLYFNVPFANGQPFDPSLWGLIFGVILLAFFGHMSVNNCAQVVLRRDASARSLIGGAVAAQVVVIALYSIWCLAVAGAVPPATLQAETGTVLAPLASQRRADRGRAQQHLRHPGPRHRVASQLARALQSRARALAGPGVALRQVAAARGPADIDPSSQLPGPVPRRTRRPAGSPSLTSAWTTSGRRPRPAHVCAWT